MRKVLLFPLFDKLRHTAVQRPVQGPDNGREGKSWLSPPFSSLNVSFHPRIIGQRGGPGLTAHGSIAAGGWGREVMRAQSTEGEPWGQRQESPPSDTTPFIISSRFSLTSPSESLGPVTPWSWGDL